MYVSNVVSICANNTIILHLAGKYVLFSRFMPTAPQAFVKFIHMYLSYVHMHLSCGTVIYITHVVAIFCSLSY